MRRLKLDDEIDLDAGPKRQRGGPDRRAGGKGLTEILCVDAIHRGEVTHAREKHTGPHDIIETLAGRVRTAERFWKMRSVSATMPPSTTLPGAGSWATCPLRRGNHRFLTAWENGPTGGVSSGEVIAVLLIANSCGYWVSEYGTYPAKNQHLQEK